MKSHLKRIFAAGAVVALGAQVFQPDRTNPESDPALSIRQDPAADPVVIDLLARACFDCHTNETQWPWYTNITPVNFLTARDVREGREHLDLSRWMELPPSRRASMAERMADEVLDGSMPLPPYLLTHAPARWSEEEKQVFLDWAAAIADSLASEKTASGK